MALGVINTQKHSLEHDNVNFHNATSYAEHNTCPDFLDPGQATLQSDRKSSSDQPNIFEELHTAELAAVSPPHTHTSWKSLHQGIKDNQPTLSSYPGQVTHIQNASKVFDLSAMACIAVLTSRSFSPCCELKLFSVTLLKVVTPGDVGSTP